MICFASCERYPVRALLGIHDPIDAWPDIWYIYDDEINTKGSLEPKRWEDDPSCADWHKVDLDFACTYQPKCGRQCVRFYWVGNVADPDKSFFGFGLMAREQVGGVVDLSKSGYVYMKFWIRGRLYQGCKFRIEIPKKGGGSWAYVEMSDSDVTSDWQEVSIQLTNIQDMNQIEYDLSMALIADGVTNGGTVYLDDIRFTKE